jgi:hypothetical protein
MKLQDAFPYLARTDERLIHNQGALGRLTILGPFGFPAICLIVQALHNTMGGLPWHQLSIEIKQPIIGGCSWEGK